MNVVGRQPNDRQGGGEKVNKEQIWLSETLGCVVMDYYIVGVERFPMFNIETGDFIGYTETQNQVGSVNTTTEKVG
jgi:hypothetical protein